MQYTPFDDGCSLSCGSYPTLCDEYGKTNEPLDDDVIVSKAASKDTRVEHRLAASYESV
jgi:hypothetical protein